MTYQQGGREHGLETAAQNDIGECHDSRAEHSTTATVITSVHKMAVFTNDNEYNK